MTNQSCDFTPSVIERSSAGRKNHLMLPFRKAINVMIMLGGPIDRKRVQVFLRQIAKLFLGNLPNMFGLGWRRGNPWCLLAAVWLAVDVVNVLALLQCFQGFGNQRRNRLASFA